MKFVWTFLLGNMWSGLFVFSSEKKNWKKKCCLSSFVQKHCSAMVGPLYQYEYSFREPENRQGYHVQLDCSHHAPQFSISSRSCLLNLLSTSATMKMELAVALTSMASACAFVTPSAFTGSVVAQQSATSTSSLQMAAKKGPVSKRGNFENAIGAQPPLGFYDPAGLLTNADQER